MEINMRITRQLYSDNIFSVIKSSLMIILICFATVKASYGMTIKTDSLSVEQLTGEWKLDHIASEKSMTEQSANMLAAMDASTRDLYKSTYVNKIFVFKSDGSFKIKQSDGRTLVGTWLITNYGQKVKLIYESGTKMTYEVLSNEEEALVLRLYANTGSISPMLNEWHLDKQ